MEETVVGFILNAINAIGTFLLGISAIFGVQKLTGNLSVKNEILYGDEATERFVQIQKKLSKSTTRQLPSLEYGGGEIKVPRLELRKISFNPQTMDDDWKGRKAIIKFYEKENGTITIRRWLL